MSSLTDGLTYREHLKTFRETGPMYQWYNDTLIGTTSPTSIIGRERVWSQNNPHFRTLMDRMIQVGGPFLVLKNDYTDEVTHVNTRGLGAWQADGHWFASGQGNVTSTAQIWPAMNTDLFSSIYLSYLTGQGATAISRAAPTKSVSDNAVAFAEIAREGIPRAIGSSFHENSARYYRNLYHQLRHKSKLAADEFLNVEFGWKPIVNDLKKTAKSIMESDDYLKALQEGSGKVVKRRYRFPTQETRSVVNTTKQVAWPGMNTHVYDTYLGTKTVTKTEKIETWFEGAFTYHFDLSGTESYEKVTAIAKRARVLYGIKVTPDVLWNLMPWSWLTDWGFNIGNVLTNVSQFSSDGLVMRYGYIMETRTISHEYNHPTTRLKYTSGPAGTRQTFSTISKARVAANPFGFGITFDGLSTRQMAILAALGMSRSL